MNTRRWLTASFAGPWMCLASAVALAQTSPYAGTWTGMTDYLGTTSCTCSGSSACPTGPAPVTTCVSPYPWTATIDASGQANLETGAGITTCRNPDGSLVSSFSTFPLRFGGRVSSSGALNIPAVSGGNTCPAFTFQFSLTPPGMSGLQQCSNGSTYTDTQGRTWTCKNDFANTFSGTRQRDVAPPPPFPMTVTSNINPVVANASAQIQYRPQDVGTQGSVFVFALAPATRVAGGQAADALKFGTAVTGRKADASIACVLAQLNASGQMVAVSSSNLAPFLTGLLSAQGASVSILNNVATPNVAGATFFVGVGPNGTTMINSGVNRAAVTVPGSVTCEPKKPKTGWWWNPQEDGRGFSLEVRGSNLFFAAFLYDVSGRSTWLVSSGPASLEGTFYTGDLLDARGGQTLGGEYPGRPTLASVGTVTMTFDSETTGTLVWPGGTVPIRRFDIVPGGLASGPNANLPEPGWWWNEQESGRGFFLEWQKGTLDIAGYMYDDAGKPVWYLTVGDQSADGATFTGDWWSYGNGQTLTGTWKPNTRLSTTVAPLTITFSGPDTALMTLPNGRTTALTRHRF